MLTTDLNPSRVTGHFYGSHQLNLTKSVIIHLFYIPFSLLRLFASIVSIYYTRVIINVRIFLYTATFCFTTLKINSPYVISLFVVCRVFVSSFKFSADSLYWNVMLDLWMPNIIIRGFRFSLVLVKWYIEIERLNLDCYIYNSVKYSSLLEICCIYLIKFLKTRMPKNSISKKLAKIE